MAADEQRRTDSGIPVCPFYSRADAADRPDPGGSPYTRGGRSDGYRRRPWTMRQYAGFASAEETNERFRLLLDRGQTGLSVAFALPTQLGLDSDGPRAAGEVGRTGVGIDSLADMERLFAGIPLGEGVSTSMTINAPASLLLLLYELVGTGQGADAGDLRGTIQNDILKEYCARGNYIFPPRPSMRLTTDTFRYASARLPRFNTISISGYPIPAAGPAAGPRAPPPPPGGPGRRGGRSPRSRSPTASPTSRRRSPPGRRSTSSRPGCRSSSTPTTTSSRKSRSSAPPAACGRTSCATASGRRIHAARRCASTPRPVARP